MLIRKTVLEGIRDGRVTVAFRRWRRPTVRSGGTLLTAAGQLEIADVRIVDAADITEADAARAGYASLDALIAELDRRSDGVVYRIELGKLGPDPRIALRGQKPTDPREQDALIARLGRMDALSRGEPWTQRVLELIGAKPGVRAGDLCTLVGQQRLPFKANVRKLKKLGLTESLKTGYRLSPRGMALLDVLSKRGSG